MPIISLETTIHAPLPIVFNLARSIDLHMHSLAHTNEKAIKGRTTGLVQTGDTVTWQAKHLGITQQLTSHITEVIPYTYFIDVQVQGAFKNFTHEHHFKTVAYGCVLMQDVFNYTSPLGVLGRLVDKLFLEKYMTSLLTLRNQHLKTIAENGSWKDLPEMVEIA